MTLTALDWLAIIAYFVVTLVLGLYFRRRSSGSTEDYFVSGRQVNWWLAGTSMVATTFAADTPLVVTGLVYTQGIAGNWLWWSFLPSGMMTVFLFARLWRRSELLTDVQFAEMRYSGKPAAFLRGFRSIYLGLIMNCIILGWVTKAMVSIVSAALGYSELTSLMICIFLIIPFTGFYVSLGGLWGVLWTDVFQFVLKMFIVIAVAYYAVQAVGGSEALLARLGEAQAAGGNAANPVAMFPDFSRGLTSEAIWTIPVLTFLVHLGLQWWAFWYPGAEPGGGGYIAQRIFAAKDERHGLLSVLWFNIAHYAVRPWPWILVGLCAILLFPGLQKPEDGYMLVVTQHAPPALRGLIIAGFLAAFMSTVATQLNWGSSYLIEDLYRRFMRPGQSERHYVTAGKLVTILLVVAAGIVSVLLGSIGTGWQVVLEIGAGTGLVYILRWYWWRVNAWSEISAMATSLVVSVGIALAGRMGYPLFSGQTSVVFAKTALTTTVITTVVWLAVTYATRPEPQELLERFYRKVRPDVRGWRRIAAVTPDVPQTRDLGRNLGFWVLGCAMIYALLIGLGKLLLGAPGIGLGLLALGGVCAFGLYRGLAATEWGGRAVGVQTPRP